MENKQGVILKDFNLSIQKSEVGESLTSRPAKATLSQERKKATMNYTGHKASTSQNANSKQMHVNEYVFDITAQINTK